MRKAPGGLAAAGMTIDRETRTARRVGLLASALSSYFSAFLVAAVNVALPVLQREFGLNAIALSWIPMLGVLGSAMLVVPVGKFADIYGRKKVFMTGVYVFTGASVLCSLAWSAPSLMTFIAIRAMGAAMILSTNMAIVTSVYPPEQRGKALGIAVASVYLGLSSGPFFGGFLIGWFGWRSLFLVVVPIGVAIILAVALKLKQEWTEAEGERFDVVGSLVFSLSLFLLVYGFSLLPGLRAFFVLGAAVLSWAFFIAWEARIDHPVLHVGLLKGNRVFAFSNLAALIHYSATSATTFLMSLYLQYVRALSPEQAGMVLVCQPVVQAALTPLAGKLSDRVEPTILATMGMGLTAASLVLLSLLTASTPFSLVLGNLALLGLGFALFSSPNLNAIMGSLDKRHYGVGSGITATARMVGQSFSMGITMLIFAVYIGRVQLGPASYPLFLKSAKLIFLIFAFFCCGSIGASLARGRVRPAS